MKQHHSFSQIPARRGLGRALCHHVQSRAMAEMHSPFIAMDNPPRLRVFQIVHALPINRFIGMALFCIYTLY
jgi:hypothetical protein